MKLAFVYILMITWITIANCQTTDTTSTQTTEATTEATSAETTPSTSIVTSQGTSGPTSDATTTATSIVTSQGTTESTSDATTPSTSIVTSQGTSESTSDATTSATSIVTTEATSASTADVTREETSAETTLSTSTGTTATLPISVLIGSKCQSNVNGIPLNGVCRFNCKNDEIGILRPLSAFCQARLGNDLFKPGRCLNGITCCVENKSKNQCRFKLYDRYLDEDDDKGDIDGGDDDDDDDNGPKRCQSRAPLVRLGRQSVERGPRCNYVINGRFTTGTCRQQCFNNEVGINLDPPRSCNRRRPPFNNPNNSNSIQFTLCPPSRTCCIQNLNSDPCASHIYDSRCVDRAPQVRPGRPLFSQFDNYNGLNFAAPISI